MDLHTPETGSEDTFGSRDNHFEIPHQESPNYTQLPDMETEEQRRALVEMLKPSVENTATHHEQYLADIDADLDKYDDQNIEIPHKKSLRIKIKEWFSKLKNMFRKKEVILPNLPQEV